MRKLVSAHAQTDLSLRWAHVIEKLTLWLILLYTYIDYDKLRMCQSSPVYLGFSYGITKTRLFKYTENFTTKKWKFSDKNSDNFQDSAQNIDCDNLCFEQK